MPDIQHRTCSLCHRLFATKTNDSVCPSCMTKKDNVARIQDILRPPFERHAIYRALCDTYPQFVKYMRRRHYAALERTLNDVISKWDRNYSFLCKGTLPSDRPGVYSKLELSAAVEQVLLIHSEDILRQWVKSMTEADVTALCRILGPTDRVKVAGTPVMAGREQIKAAWEFMHNAEVETK